eukprot:TRINITY_DN1503_c0_g1_i11.p1 TRINITY_DN1503_c0_g1~~TRINITY_DN1503_c0_g1_i11.p1  ORF type:complete len:338 (+),score=57.32 TRINITY_DN1503_c0_g1_i11:68-1081(+)
MDTNQILVYPPTTKLTTGCSDTNLHCTITPSSPRKKRTGNSEAKRTGDRERKTSIFQLGLDEEDKRSGLNMTSIVPTESDVRELSDLCEEKSKTTLYPTRTNTQVEDCCAMQPIDVSEVGEITIENLFGDNQTDFTNVSSFFDTKDVLTSDVKIFFVPPEEKESSTFTEQVLDNTYKREENGTLPSTSSVLLHETHLDGEDIESEKNEHCKDNAAKDDFVSKENLSLLSLSEIKTLALVCGLGTYGSEKLDIVFELWNVFAQLQESNSKNFQDVEINGQGEQDPQIPLNLTTLTSQIQTLANYLREDHNCFFLNVLEKFFTLVYADAKRRLGKYFRY